MTVNISARPFQLLINGIDRTANFVECNLTSNEVGAASQGVSGVRINGTITLQANYNEILDFTYLASPEIGANWAQGVEVIYKVANDAGVLTTLYTLYILKEPDPPDQTQYRITLQVGDISTLRNSRSADKDFSDVIAGQETSRALVILRYLNAANIPNDIGSIPYPFYFPQPKTKGGSLINIAEEIARSANHILYSDRLGTVRNRAINLNAAPIATFTLGQDEKFFDNNKSIETPVGELTIAGLVTNIKDNTYPKVTSNVSKQKFTTFGYSLLNGFTSRQYEYITQRVTITDFGWDGTQEKIETFTESALVLLDLIEELANDELAFLTPSSIKTYTKKYDSKNRLIEESELDDVYILNYAKTTETIRNGLNGFNYTNYQFATKLRNKDTVTTYRYNETTDELISKRTEITNYVNTFTESILFGETAREETWLDGAYTVANFYKDVPLYSTARVANRAIASGASLDWIPSTTETVYSTDSSTKPPQTIYRQQYEPIETPIKVTLKAKPFAGDAYKDRTPPIEVPFLTSIEQASDFGNTYLSLLYGRKQGFSFVTAISTNLINNLVPLARVNVIYRGVIYECLADAITWGHNLTEMAIGFNLIVLRTALVTTPETTNNLANSSPVIKARSIQRDITDGDLITNPYFGGRSIQFDQASGNLISGYAFNARSIQIDEAEGNLVNLDPVLISGRSIQVDEAEGDLANDSSGFDADAQAVITAIEATGLTLNTTQKNAINSRIVAAKSDGVWSKWVAYYGFVGGTAAAHAINWKNPSLYLITWVGTLTHNSLGVKGDGTTGYGNTGIIPSVDLSNSSLHLATYQTIAKTTLEAYEIGCLNSAGTNGTYLVNQQTPSGRILYFQNGLNDFVGTTPNSSSKAYLAGDVLGGVGRTFINNVQINSASFATSSANPLINLPIYVLHLNYSPSPINYRSDGGLGSVMISSGLTNTERGANYASELAFQTALGRN